jgi:hypothetical protein
MEEIFILNPFSESEQTESESDPSHFLETLENCRMSCCIFELKKERGKGQEKPKETSFDDRPNIL